MNITGFHDSALCCVGAVKNSLDIYSLPWGATILVKTVGTIRAFSPSSITMLIFHGLQSQDPFIDSWHVSTLSGGEGERKNGNDRRTNVAHITMEACTVNCLLFAQNLTSVPKCFHPDCRCDNIKQCLQSTIVFLRHITAIKSAAAFGRFRLCHG